MKTLSVSVKLDASLKMRRISRKDAATHLGVTKATISNWCRGYALPPISESIKLLALIATKELLDELPGWELYQLTISQIISEKLQLKKEKWEKLIKENYPIYESSL